MGFEPMAFSMATRRSQPLNYAGPVLEQAAGLEPAAVWMEARYSAN